MAGVACKCEFVVVCSSGNYAYLFVQNACIHLNPVLQCLRFSKLSQMTHAQLCLKIQTIFGRDWHSCVVLCLYIYIYIFIYTCTVYTLPLPLLMALSLLLQHDFRNRCHLSHCLVEASKTQYILWLGYSWNVWRLL